MRGFIPSFLCTTSASLPLGQKVHSGHDLPEGFLLDSSHITGILGPGAPPNTGDSGDSVTLQADREVPAWISCGVHDCPYSLRLPESWNVALTLNSARLMLGRGPSRTRNDSRVYSWFEADQGPNSRIPRSSFVFLFLKKLAFLIIHVLIELFPLKTLHH